MTIRAGYHPSPRLALFAAILALAAIQPVLAQTCATSTPPSVLTAQYGPQRQGYNGSESMLTSTCLTSGAVTLKQPNWSPLRVDSGPGQPNQLEAQPLYVSQLSPASPLPNCPSPCNMLVGATLTSSVYAWNADTGATIWSDCQGAGCTNNALWVEDCGPSGSIWAIPPGVNPAAGALPFAGIVSTPVIDTTANPPVIYLTSLCQTGPTHSGEQWWIHELNLYTGVDQVPQQQIGTPAGASVAFLPWSALQRPALLEVQVPGATPNPLIYLSFGFAGASEVSVPYHGWVFAYDSALTRQIAFVTTGKNTANNTDLPACTTGCVCNSTGCKATEECIEPNYDFAANWCGHAGGIWMSGRGPAAAADSNGVSHAYFGTGNGGFQQLSQNGQLLGSMQNWGTSIFDFRLGASLFDTRPSEYFTPYGGPAVPLQQSFLGNEPGGNPVPQTFQGLNQNDFDLAVSGILLFNDLGGNPRLLTIDKAGYGYMLTQGNLCGSPGGCYPGVSGGAAGGAANDPGNAFSFAANQEQCPDQVNTLPGSDKSCHRITSMAFNTDISPPPPLRLAQQ